ncbi:hypothetical protein PCASD_19750 [Puccinia coronata f. sp. avenae]|uniref:Uncharacterized protein n=1 Tax=Puccinia coronata f. sp. avenae TaxID=200324 RepID=A0A2N5TUC7_9BASI|nr:hypothetical protein PCASD_19750 [Puccinia coronata f. sp. avenae]
MIKSISNGRGVDRPGFGGLQADVPKCHRCVTLVQFMDCQLMAGVDPWRAKLPKVAAKGGIGPPPPLLAASVAAPLEDNYTLRAAKSSSAAEGSSKDIAELLASHLARFLDQLAVDRARFSESFLVIDLKPH